MKNTFLLSIGNFFAAAHYFLVIYISAPYLATVMASQKVGLVVSSGAILGIAGYLFMPHLVRKFGPRILGIGFSLLTISLLLILAMAPIAPIAIVAIGLLSVSSLFIGYQLDLLLEAASDNALTTGQTRALFITAANIALIGTPLLIGYLLGATEDYYRVFFAAALTLLPFVLLLYWKKFPENDHVTLHTLSHTAHCLVHDKDIRTVLYAGFLLNFFFYLAPLYIPLYLNTVLGIPWSELGWIFAVMLMPFVLLEYPAGWMADNKWGDKELMAFGFTLIGFFFAAVGFITPTTSILTILIILVGTRIGGAVTEAMVEGHFFRRIAASDTSSIAVFRLMRPFAMLAAPLFATFLLLITSYNVFFLLSGILILIAGVWIAFNITDAR
ncbi:MFS transporter [Patescibacteria group bacterium]|nr:MFS transporter [Patescibacteria group bacterium]MBU1755054.1 MFS transporter [Patescibacteria group bacterium]